MRIAILTSSRADYGIYLPLLKALKEDPYFDIQIIVFGTHLSSFHGHTIDQITKDGFEVRHQIESMLICDSPNAISTAIALTALKFSDFWKDHKKNFDLVFCLGDRYEMFAAVISGIPYNIPFAHLHGGEITVCAIDNIFRHSITLASKWHFVAHESFKERIHELTQSYSNIIVTGSLSLVNIHTMCLLSPVEFYKKWNINLHTKSILVTLHPETVDYKKNEINAFIIKEVLLKLSYEFQIIITMPNADTSGTIFRSEFQALKNCNSNKIFLIENFGIQSFFSCMKNVVLVIGNSSSGIIESASFGKFFINIGDRQKGRLKSANTIDTPFNSECLLTNIKQYANKKYNGNNVYYQKDPVGSIINYLKQIH